MAKQEKKVAAPVAKVAKVAPAAKLTRRNATPSDVVLVVTPKGSSKDPRAAQNLMAWTAVKAAAPATAAVLAGLAVYESKDLTKKVVGPVFVSYMQRRGYLAAK